MTFKLDTKNLVNHFELVDLKISQISYKDSLKYVVERAIRQIPTYVCFANSHMLIEARYDSSFAQDVNNANLVLADGFPLKVGIKYIHKKHQDRISGMDFLPDVMKILNFEGLNVFIIGSTTDVHLALRKTISSTYPNIKIVGCISPPFNENWNNKSYIELINKANTNIVLVALGCPKQEKWMAKNHKDIHATLLGIGGALPVFAGIAKNAPMWMKNNGLEWLFRLLLEPRRLWKRYLITNTLTLFLISKQLLYRFFKKKNI